MRIIRASLHELTMGLYSFYTAAKRKGHPLKGWPLVSLYWARALLYAAAKCDCEECKHAS